MLKYEYNAFTRKEKLLIRKEYFNIIKEDDLACEVCSKNTKHYWVIVKKYAYEKYPVWLYHKHKKSDLYYHLHWKCYTVEQAVKDIISHDDFVLKNR